MSRAGINRLIRDSEKQLFTVVMFWQLDRLMRNTLKTLDLVYNVFLKNGIEIVSTRQNIDTTTAYGRFVLTVLAAQAELELEITKERTALGRLGRVKSGKVLMGGIRPFGYNYSKETGLLTINEPEAKIIRKIYKDFLKGDSLTRLKTKLNKAGHLEKQVNWRWNMISDVLKNPIYCGYSKINDLLFEGRHEPIVSKNIFKKAQKKLLENREKTRKANNNPAPFQVKYMLSSLLKCGYCGTPLEIFITKTRQNIVMMCGYRCRNKYPRKDVSGVTVYNNNQKCDSPTYDKTELENFVISQVVKIQNDDSFFEEICEKDQNYYDKLAKVKKLIGFEDFGSLDYDAQKVIIRALIKSITVRKDNILIEWEI